MGSYTGRDLNSLNCYINRKFKGLSGAVRAGKGPCVGQASPPIPGLPWQPPLSPVFLGLVGGGDPALQTKVNCFGSSWAWPCTTAAQPPLPGLRAQTFEASFAAILWKCGRGLFMDGEVGERQRTQPSSTWGWQECGGGGAGPWILFWPRPPSCQNFSFSVSIHSSFPRHCIYLPVKGRQSMVHPLC